MTAPLDSLTVIGPVFRQGVPDLQIYTKCKFHRVKKRKACDNLPPERARANEERDLPAAYNRSRTDEAVRRIGNGTLWSIS